MKALLNITSVFLLLVTGMTLLPAQQLPLFSVHRDQWKVLNPAAISNNYLLNEMNLTVGASYRRQWFGLEDGPNTQLIHFEYLPEAYDRIITGGHIVRDQAGKIGQMGLYGNFAYRLEFGRRVEHALAIGLGAGLVQYRARIADIAFEAPEVAGFDNSNVIFPDFSLGLFYYHSDQYYAGLSVPQLFGLKTIFRDSLNERAFDIKRVQHIYALAGAYIDVGWFGSNTSFIEPSFWLRYVPNSPLSADLQLRYQISDFFWLGLGGGIGLGQQPTSVIHTEFGFKLGESVNIYNGQWKIGFAYDIPLSRYQTFFGNMLEINAAYSWFR
ncbi:MAG TPA: PorP/SprF family type IX secretion system membrane protein [Saprospiraceae bacterium]|nr:PorP/SprF family type IX secretion system membrane protein [Saprospiraceae bacterium]HMQ83667.1 PorP/SprF family type IX secretion system membrane protein [Saprospiraceae bacterium]